MRMRNSRSQVRIANNLDRTHSQKMFYVNDQLSRSKDISTIFHSPYKDGKKNTNYTNPTFLSSNLFYAEQQVKKQVTPRHNLIYNKNQRSRKQLYDKRMQKADNLTVAVHQAAASDIQNRQQNRRVNDESQQPIARSRSRIRQDKSEQLAKQLQTLIKYRQQDEKRNRTSRIYTQSVYRQNVAPETPIYIQKNRLETEQRAIQQNKKNLKQWIQISEKIKNLKDSASQRGKEVETKAMDSYIMTHAQRKYQKQMESRRNAGMLANILREQIKQAQAKKQQERRNFY